MIWHNVVDDLTLGVSIVDATGSVVLTNQILTSRSATFAEQLIGKHYRVQHTIRPRQVQLSRLGTEHHRG